MSSIWLHSKKLEQCCGLTRHTHQTTSVSSSSWTCAMNMLQGEFCIMNMLRGEFCMMNMLQGEFYIMIALQGEFCIMIALQGEFYIIGLNMNLQ